MNELNHHYRMLLGLDEAWQVDSVDLSLEAKRVEILLSHKGGPLICPECGGECSRADTAPERTWRHLDTMRFETVLRARTPRCNCASCGIKTVEVPWAGKHSRFTLMFEAFAIEVLQACSSVSAAALLLNIDWDTAHEIMKRAVDRGTQRRDTESIEQIGIDEKSFSRGQSYISVMTDISGSRVLEVVEGRDEKSVNRLWETLTKEQCAKIKAVAMDMWQPFVNSTNRSAPNAEIVFDRFHVSKHLNDGVDQVRRQENKALQEEGDKTLTGTKQLWLFNPENLSFRKFIRFSELKEQSLKTGKAWAIKEHFRMFWDCLNPSMAESFFQQWYTWASRCQLTPMVKKAAMIKNHLPNLLTYFKHKITNAMSEGFNSKIQQIKSNARGFRSFVNYRTRILFFCGRLELAP